MNINDGNVCLLKRSLLAETTRRLINAESKRKPVFFLNSHFQFVNMKREPKKGFKRLLQENCLHCLLSEEIFLSDFKNVMFLDITEDY